MGLIVNFFIFVPPYLNIVGNDGSAAAIIDMNVPNNLLTATPHPRQCLHLPLIRAQQLCCEIPESLRLRQIF